MDCFLRPNGSIYFGDKASGDDVGVPAPISTPPWMPESVTPYQAIQALNAAGKLPQVEAAINAADKMTQYAWQRATSFDRDSDIVRLLATGLGWTDADLDALFVSAAGFV